MDDPFTTRELKTMFHEIRETMSRVEAQTLKTNGRVGSLERWRAYMSGAIAALASILIPIAYLLVDKHLV